MARRLRMSLGARAAVSVPFPGVEQYCVCDPYAATSLYGYQRRRGRTLRVPLLISRAASPDAPRHSLSGPTRRFPFDVDRREPSPRRVRGRRAGRMLRAPVGARERRNSRACRTVPANGSDGTQALACRAIRHRRGCVRVVSRFASTATTHGDKYLIQVAIIHSEGRNGSRMSIYPRRYVFIDNRGCSSADGRVATTRRPMADGKALSAGHRTGRT